MIHNREMEIPWHRYASLCNKGGPKETSHVGHGVSTALLQAVSLQSPAPICACQCGSLSLGSSSAAGWGQAFPTHPLCRRWEAAQASITFLDAFTEARYCWAHSRATQHLLCSLTVRPGAAAERWSSVPREGRRLGALQQP